MKTKWTFLFLLLILLACGHGQMATPTHDHTLEFILVHEAGLTPDGLTYAGITQHTWTPWRAKQKDKSHLPKLVKDIPNNPKLNALEDKKATPIVKRFYYDYFHEWHAWDVHPALQLIYSDFVTLSGSAAVREMQKLAGIAPDGVWGYHTGVAVKKYNDAVKNGWKAFLKFDKMKRDYFHELATKHPDRYGQYLHTWLKRSDDLKTYMEGFLK